MQLFVCGAGTTCIPHFNEDNRAHLRSTNTLQPTYIDMLLYDIITFTIIPYIISHHMMQGCTFMVQARQAGGYATFRIIRYSQSCGLFFTLLQRRHFAIARCPIASCAMGRAKRIRKLAWTFRNDMLSVLVWGLTHHDSSNKEFFYVGSVLEMGSSITAHKSC